MTNEDLVIKAKAGDRDALAQLWEQNRGLLATLFSELARKAGARMAALGVTWEDVEQSFFLDESVSGEDGSQTPRGELVPDPAAGRQFEDAEERLYTAQLHADLEDCINTLDERRAAVIRARYFEDKTLSEIGERFGVNTSRVGQLERDAMRKLRSGRNIQRLRQYREMIISKHAYHGTGLSAWKYGGGSVEEWTLVYLEGKGLL